MMPYHGAAPAQIRRRDQLFPRQKCLELLSRNQKIHRLNYGQIKGSDWRLLRR